MKKNPETLIQNSVRDFLRWNGWYVIRNQQGLGSHKGMADLTVVKNGVTVWIEVKTKTGQLSEHQLKFRRDIINAGGNFEVARSPEDADRINQKYGGGKSVMSLLAEV